VAQKSKLLPPNDQKIVLNRN